MDAYRTRDALAAGVPPYVLRRRGLARIRGARAPLGARTRDLIEALLEPGQAFTGPTAAEIWDLPLPRALAADPAIHVSSLAPRVAMRRPSVVGSRRAEGAVIRRAGRPVLDPLRVWRSLAPMLAVPDLVAIGDRLVTGTLRTPALVSLEGLRACAAGATGRGAVALHRAGPLVRIGPWSRPESLLRLLVRDAGLPEPRHNLELAVQGGTVRIDLAWPTFRVGLEYDGVWHDDRRQRLRDLERHERVADTGWDLIHVRAPDLFVSPRRLVARVHRRLARRGPIGPLEVARVTTFTP